MIGKRDEQTTLYDVGNVFPLELDPKSFYGQLVAVAGQLFSDDDFAALYSEGTGRPGTPPSLLALTVLMQNYEGLSDRDAIDRTAYDLRWAAVLRLVAGKPLCSKSTLQLFRSHLVLHEKFGLVLQSSLNHARKSGLLKGDKLTAAVDTKPIIGRGAVEDTYNLLARGMTILARALARQQQESFTEFLAKHELSRLEAKSIKGSADLDWSDEPAKSAFLTTLVADARRLLALADGGDEEIKSAAELLEQLLLQDIAEAPGSDGQMQATIKQGTAAGRIPSATDPEQRHGRKSKSKRFVGSKAAVTVDVESALVLSTEVLPGDAGDATKVLPLVQQAEVNSGAKIVETLGDCAYGSGATRQQFEEADRALVAKVPATPVRGETFPKTAFNVVLPAAGESLRLATVTCPNGAIAGRSVPDTQGGVTFYFDKQCDSCPLRALCTTAAGGRSISVHPQEHLLQEARALQQTPEGRQKLRRRLVVENGLARLGQLGIGQARYKGRAKTHYQLTIAAAVANFRRTWNWVRQQGLTAPQLRPVGA